MKNLSDETKKESSGMRAWMKDKHIGALLLLVCLPPLIVYAFIGSSGSGSSKKFKNDIIVATKYHVKKQLKSPSTAKFCKQNELSITETSNSVIVTGYVDAQNSFGGTVRSYFTLTFTRNGKSLKSIYIN